ncbi:MAG TPA: alpha/beta hydrolase [Psychrobacter sp.]|uniref:alpha/beta hydrolase n=1 Tax=Psychrobacter sp. TaxID=56811 RepID=UPI002C9EA286|nr:alpha/beta hydrolase [Psychrobacter sp.]HSP85281.1 alpha/beta hydrolase [Psychrobacter sp.]
MPNSTVSSTNTLLNKTLMALHLASNDETSSETKENSVQEKRLSVKEKVLSYNPITNYQLHTLHYAIKSFGYLPAPVLESLIGYLNGPTSKQYMHVDAHLRLILAVNSKLKIPLQLIEMTELRKRFAADAVAMQSPKVWQQVGDKSFGNMKPFAKKAESAINWEDKTIANADDGDMTIRCYQKQMSNTGFGFKKVQNNNPDETVLLFFHGGGFCIGDLNTHHEFCHALCEQTGWPVVSVDYRLAPEHPAPTAVRDCITAYAWLVEHCETFGALPSRILLAGDSAGGGLSTLIAQQIITPDKNAWLDLGDSGQKTFDILQHLPHPMAQMPLYPVTDIETDYPSWELYGEGLLLDHADVAVFDAACLENSLLPRQHILTSPMLGDNRHVCPSYVVAAELDVLRDEAFAYASQLKNYGIAVQTHTVLGAPHGFIHFMSVHQRLGQETQHIITGFASFVREIIKTRALLSA